LFETVNVTMLDLVSSSGNEFHIIGPATGKAQWPCILNWHSTMWYKELVLVCGM